MEILIKKLEGILKKKKKQDSVCYHCSYLDAYLVEKKFGCLHGGLLQGLCHCAVAWHPKLSTVHSVSAK